MSNQTKTANNETLNQNEQKEILYNEIRDVQIELKKYCSQKNFELFLINKESRINDKDMKNFKIELKKYYIQQFFIQISTQKISPKFLYNIDPEITNDKEKTSNFSDIISNSIRFNEFVQLSVKIPTNDLFQIYLWTFSVIPSYFNFFLSNDDESYFLFFLEKLKIDYINYFYIYSSIIYYHPLFLNFCKNVFDPVFESVLHEDKDQYDPPSKCLQNLQKTIHLCPSIIKKVLSMIPESERMTHAHQYFYEPLVLFPHRFFVLPEYYVLPHRTIQVLNLAFDNFIIELVQNEHPLNLHLQDRNNLLFASFDLEFIRYKIALSKRRISTGGYAHSRMNQNNLNNAKINVNQNDTNQNVKSDLIQNQNSQLNQNQQVNQLQNKDQIPSFNQNQNQAQAINQNQIPQTGQMQIPQNKIDQAQNLSQIQNQTPMQSINQNQQIAISQTQQTNQNQAQPINQNQAQPINQNQAQPINQNQVQPINQNQAQPINQNQAQPINQNQVQSINQNQAQPINQNQVQSINQNQVQSINQNQAQPINQNQIQSINQNQQIAISQAQQTNQNQAQPINQNQAQPINQNQAQPINQNQAQPINQNQAQPINQNQAQPINQNQVQSINQNQQIAISQAQQMNQNRVQPINQNQMQPINHSQQLNQKQVQSINYNQQFNQNRAQPINYNQQFNQNRIPQMNQVQPINQNQIPLINQNQAQYINPNQQFNQNRIPQMNQGYARPIAQMNQNQIRQINQGQAQSFNQNQSQSINYSQQFNQSKVPQINRNQFQQMGQNQAQFAQMNQNQIPRMNQAQVQQFNQNRQMNQTQVQQMNPNQFQQISQNQNRQINQNQVYSMNQNQQIISRQNQSQIPSFNQVQSLTPQNQNQIQAPQFNQIQNPTAQNQSQNQTQAPQFKQVQSPTTQNQNQIQTPQFNQVQNPTTQNQNQIQTPQFNQVQNQNQTQVPQFNQVQSNDQFPSMKQGQEPFPHQDQNPNPKLSQRRFSLAPTKNPNSSVNPTPNPNSNSNASRRLSLTSKKQPVNKDKNAEASDSSSSQNPKQETNQKSNKSLNTDSLPKSNFNPAGGMSFNRKRSVSAVSKLNGDLTNKEHQRNINNYKYTFIEVNKDKDRRDANEFLNFEKCLSDSFFSSTDEVFPLSKSPSFNSSSSSSIFLSDLQNAYLSASSSTREEVTSFFHIFRKLLQESDPLPLLDFKNKSCNDKLNIIDILYEFLVKKGGNLSNFIERAAYFETIRDFLTRIGGNDLRKMITTYKTMAHTMKELINDKKSFVNYMKKTRFLFDRMFLFYKLIFRLGDTFLYDESRRKTSKEIVDDPYSFYLNFEQNRSIDPVIAKIQYHAFIHNLRFEDFCKSHPELSKYDKLAFEFIETNREMVIESQTKNAKLFNKLNLINDRFLFDPIVRSIQHAFEINAVPYEKFEIIRKCFENVEGWLKNVMEYGADDMLPFTIFIFALANPKRFISNTVFMNLFLLSSIWNIEPNEAPVISTRLKSFIGVTFHTFSELTTFLPIKVFKIEIMYILDYSKLQNNENNQENNNNNVYIKKNNYTCLMDSIDEDKIREIGKPFRTIYQDESPYLGELIFYDFSQSFSMNSNVNINQNTEQNSNENENSGIISNLFANFGSKKNPIDLLIVETDRIEFARKAVSKNKNIQKKMIFCSKNVSDEMKQLDIQCFKIMPRFSLCKALKEIMNVFVKF